MRAQIKIDPKTLIATIIVPEKNLRLINNLKIICSSLNESYVWQRNLLSIPWFDLRRGISSIAFAFKRENTEVEFDDFSTQLVKDAITDRKNLKDRQAIYKVDDQVILDTLIEEGFIRTLKKEQLRDTKILLELKHGANFSVPGAGKTTTILAVHTLLKNSGLVNKLFVISPINAFISWEEEVNEIFKEKPLKITRLQKQHFNDIKSLEIENPDIVLVNYEKLRKEIEILIPFFIINKIHLVLDESHRIKSGMSNISYSQIIKVADIAKRRDILSGTPMPQSYLDLEPQFDYLWPGEKIIPNGFSTSSDSELIQQKINENIRGLYARTTKNELGLPEPIIDYIEVEMGPIQAELYRLFKSETARILAGIDKPNMFQFRRIGRSVVKLLQAATNPMLLTLRDDYDEETLSVPQNKEFWELLEDFRKYEKPIKIEFLKKRVDEIIQVNKSNKVLIWSYFVRNILILEKIFRDYNPVTIFGGVPSGTDDDVESNREGRIRKFHEDDTCRVMIANPQACGEGISLHKVCHHAIYLDRNFNAAYYLQSIDRIHRLGLPKNVETRIEILVSKNSIEELLINRLNNKILAMGNVLEDPYLRSLAYDPSDIPINDEHGIDFNDFTAIKEHVEAR